MTFNQAQFAAVVETAKAKAANSPRRLRAIDRAAEALASGELVVTLLQNYALVTSPRGSYRVNGACECEAARRGHRECRHRAAVRITELLEAETAPVVSRPALIADIRAAWSRNFPGLSLADELLRRFKVNTLDYLAEDMLRGVLAVCA
jgi:hypothetical protein